MLCSHWWLRLRSLLVMSSPCWATAFCRWSDSRLSTWSSHCSKYRDTDTRQYWRHCWRFYFKKPCISPWEGVCISMKWNCCWWGDLSVDLLDANRDGMWCQTIDVCFLQNELWKGVNTFFDVSTMWIGCCWFKSQTSWATLKYDVCGLHKNRISLTVEQHFLILICQNSFCESILKPHYLGHASLVPWQNKTMSRNAYFFTWKNQIIGSGLFYGRYLSTLRG